MLRAKNTTSLLVRSLPSGICILMLYQTTLHNPLSCFGLDPIYINLLGIIFVVFIAMSKSVLI